MTKSRHQNMSQNSAGPIIESQVTSYIFPGVSAKGQQVVFAITQIVPWLTKRKSQSTLLSVTTLVNEFRLIFWACITEVGSYVISTRSETTLNLS